MARYFNSIFNYFRTIDKVLFWSVVSLSLIGVINLWGVVGAESQFFQKQVIFVAAGVILMSIASLVNYRLFRNSSYFVFLIYILSIVLLLIPLFSHQVRGVQSWIIIGGFTIEPSELAKLALIILMAKFLSQRHLHINGWPALLGSIAYFAIPAGIIFYQPDLGSAVILTLIWVTILLVAGINKRHLFMLISIGVCFSFVGWAFVLKPYQKERIISFVNPYLDPRGAGYNLIQSKIAIGSGYIFGNGFGNGTQANLGLLPEPHNDFAFSSFFEQFGLIGSLVLIGTTMLVVWRILVIGSLSQTNFGRLFCIGVATMIFGHAFVSMAVNVGLMPVTGLPYTFLSYGGSHTLSAMIAVGLVQSIKING